MLIKKIISVLLLLVLVMMLPISVFAANYKSSISNFKDKGSLKYKEELLCSFDDTSLLTETAPEYSFDTKDKKQGNASYVAKLPAGEDRVSVFKIEDFGRVLNMTPQKNSRITFKMWINISDTSKLKADHEGNSGYSYADYSDFATVYFRAASNNHLPDHHSVNQTVRGSGWQELEIDLSVCYGATDGFDITKVTSCFMFVFVKEATTIKIDDLRVCYYTNDGYAQDSSDIIEGAKVISTCDFDALDGVLVNEWFNSDFSTDIKHSGSSSLHLFSDGGDDQRLYISDNDILLDRNNDCLCFWMYIDDPAKLNSLFIELNEDQDVHEYELKNAAKMLKRFTKERNYEKNWFMIQIPLDSMTATYRNNKTAPVTLKNLRIVPSTTSGNELNVYIDSIFLATKEQVDAYNSVYAPVTSIITSTKPATSLSGKTSSVSQSTESDSTMLYVILAASGVVLVVIIVAVIIIVKKKTKK